MVNAQLGLFLFSEKPKLSVIRQNGKSQTGYLRKQNMPNFLKNDYVLPPDTHTHTCAYQGVRYVRFS